MCDVRACGLFLGVRCATVFFHTFGTNYLFPLILDISRAKMQKRLCAFEYCVYLMVGVSVNIKYSYHVINVKQYLRTPVQRAIRTGVRGARPPPTLGGNQLTLFQPGDRLCPHNYWHPPIFRQFYDNFVPRVCKNTVAHRTPINEPHARTYLYFFFT